MERDQFHVETETVEEPATAEPVEHPVLRIHFDGSRDRLRQGLSERLREDIAVEEIDDAVVPLRVRHTIGRVSEQERPIVELDLHTVDADSFASDEVISVGRFSPRTST